MESQIMHSNKYKIGYSDVDFKKELKPSSLFGLFQDTASVAAEKLGAGVVVLAEEFSVAWILTRIKVQIDRTPILDEVVMVETWPHQPGRLEFERDYRVRDASGNVIVRSVSNWALMDINTRELRRADTIHIDYPRFMEEHALESKPGRLKPTGQPEEIYRKLIGYSDVDFNGHINNTRYIDYTMDCFPVECHRQYRVGTIEVNYIKEAFPGDTLIMYREISAVDSSRVYIEGVSENDGKTVFRAQVEVVAR
ncbi:MAG TPA: acyl-ACP thioesterase domain-containing protein [Clostridia bacterium]|nr:acyl-ACP thioesterase domain-containing protein [Clostridia bacterium]